MSNFTVIVACCVLHNIAVMYKEDNVENNLIDDLSGDDDNEDHIPQNALPPVNHLGIVIRQHLFKTLP